KKERKDGRRANPLDASEVARRSLLVEKAVSFAATLIDRWTRSNDAKFLLAINGDDLAALKENVAQTDWDKTGNIGALAGRVESGSGAFRRALTRLATAETSSRDRLAEIAASLDPRVLANAQVFIVSVAAFDGARLAESENETSGIGEIGKIEVKGEAGAVATAAARGIGGRWRDARLIDASANDFDDYFEF
ncbi:MAG: hypothetical protein IJX36_00960, partial [Thermoguttaceae bacterium]|nr:hypothetical protein [Thermoguttaceae bacterium]